MVWAFEKTSWNRFSCILDILKDAAIIKVVHYFPVLKRVFSGGWEGCHSQGCFTYHHDFIFKTILSSVWNFLSSYTLSDQVSQNESKFVVNAGCWIHQKFTNKNHPVSKLEKLFHWRVNMVMLRKHAGLAHRTMDMQRKLQGLA